MTFFNGIPPDTTASSSFDGCVVTLMLECLLVKTMFCLSTSRQNDEPLLMISLV